MQKSFVYNKCTYAEEKEYMLSEIQRAFGWCKKAGGYIEGSLVVDILKSVVGIFGLAPVSYTHLFH